jgi:hypothetical protein
LRWHRSACGRGVTPIESGDAFIFQPGEAHQIINDGDRDLIVYVIADNPISESIYLPDEKKWIVKIPRLSKSAFRFRWTLRSRRMSAAAGSINGFSHGGSTGSGVAIPISPGRPLWKRIHEAAFES